MSPLYTGYSGFYNTGFGTRGSIIPKGLDVHGNRYWKVTVEPELEPITVDELKTFARIDGSTEDTLLSGFIAAVRKNAEMILGRALIRQVITLTMDFWPSTVIKLPRTNLIDVLEVRTISEADVTTVYASSNYYVRTNIDPGQLVLKRSVTPPINTDRDFGGYEVEYWAGYGSAASDVPQAIRDALKLWAASVYENRTISENPPPEAAPLLLPYKVPRI